MDLALWQGRNLTMARDFESMMAMKASSAKPFGNGDTVKLVLLHNDRWLYPENEGSIYECEQPCYSHVSSHQLPHHNRSCAGCSRSKRSHGLLHQLCRCWAAQCSAG